MKSTLTIAVAMSPILKTCQRRMTEPAPSLLVISLVRGQFPSEFEKKELCAKKGCLSICRQLFKMEQSRQKVAKSGDAQLKAYYVHTTCCYCSLCQIQ